MSQQEEQHPLLPKASEALMDNQGHVALQTELYPTGIGIKIFSESRRISTYRLNGQQRLFYTIYTHPDGNLFIVLLGIDEEHKPNTHSVTHSSYHRLNLAKKAQDKILETYYPSSYRSQAAQVNPNLSQPTRSEKRFTTFASKSQTPMEWLNEATKYLWADDLILRNAAENILFSKYIWGTPQRAKKAQQYWSSFPYIEKFDFVSVFIHYKNFEKLADGIFDIECYAQKNRDPDQTTIEQTSDLKEILSSIEEVIQYDNLIAEILRKLISMVEAKAIDLKETEATAFCSRST